MTKLHSDQRINWLNQTSGFNTVNGLKIVRMDGWQRVFEC